MTERVALITGASGGIGAELARIFAAHKHRVVLVARQIDKLRLVSDGIIASGGALPILIACDLEQPDACDVIAQRLREADVEVEYVVNNAGFGLFGNAIQLDRNEQLHVLDVNVRALTDLSLRFSDSLIRHRGGILNVGSIASFFPGPGMAVYYASKAYVLSFTEALHRELEPKGVRVTALCPGPVASGFQERAGFAAGADSKVLDVSAADVAKVGYRALMANQRIAIPGMGNKIIPFIMRFLSRGFILNAVGRVQLRRVA